MDAKIGSAVAQLEDALSPYGYYLGEGQEESSLRLTFVELGVFALGILVWGLTEYAKGVIADRAKRDADRIFGKDKPQEDALRRQLSEVLAELRGLKDRLQTTEEVLLRHISEDRLIELLHEQGMSPRAARQATLVVRPILVNEVTVLLTEDA